MDNLDNDVILNRKNTLAFDEAIKRLYASMQVKEEQIIGLQNTIASMANRLTLLEQALMIQRVMAMGHGASVQG